MKRIILPALCLSLALTSCKEELLTSPEPIVDECEELVLSMSTATLTKGLIKDTQLPNGSSVGITIMDTYGYYSGELYNNVEYTSRDEDGQQIWEAESPIMLSAETGTLFAFYPFSESLDQISSIPLNTTSVTQVDYMYGVPVTVNKDKRNATIVMKHALAAVKISYVRGTYTGAGKVTKVSFGGDCIGTSAYLDATDGSLYNITGKGAMIGPGMNTKTLSTSLQESEIIVIPTGGTKGKVVITIDGTDYTLEFEDIALRQGEITQFDITVDSGELSLSDITVSEWTYLESQGTVIKVSDKVTLTGDLENIAVHNSVTDGTVTIKATPISGEISFTEVAPVTFTGTAVLTQSSDIDTGVRTITISDITTNVEVIFAGTIEYHVILKLNSEQGVAHDMLGANVTPLWEQRQTFSRMDWNDQSILSKIVEDGKYTTKYKVYTFPTSGTQTIKCLFKNNVMPNNIFQSCDYFYARIGGKTKKVDYSAFMTCGLKELYLSEGIETIGSQAFYGNSFTTLKLPSTLTSYENIIINYCPYLASIILPENIQKIGNLFGTCQRLAHITCKAKSAPKLDAENIFQKLPDNGVLVVPEGANYSTWMTSENLGGKNWTIVYMDL